MCRWRWALGVLVLPALLNTGTRPADVPSTTARAGFARTNITPPVGIDLGGRGCSGEASDRLLDPLFAQGTLLEDARGERLMIVSFDLIGLSHDLGETLRDSIADTLKLDAARVLLNCSHTHSGPMMIREAMAACGELPEVERQYREQLKAAVLQLCADAEKSLRPVVVSVHEGSCEIGINRRGRTPAGTTAMIPNPDGPCGRSVWVLAFDSPEGKPLGVLFSYPCHAVIVYGYARRAISADFPAAARGELEAAFGPHLHAQFLQGCAGDIRPRALADVSKHRFRVSTPADKERVGRELASTVVEAMKHSGRRLALNIDARTTTAQLARGERPARAIYEHLLAGNDHRARAAKYWLDQYDRGGPAKRPTHWPTGVVRLADDQYLCWLAGEPVFEWAATERNWFGGKPVLSLGYTQEVTMYLPVDALLAEGGYEVNSSNHFRLEYPGPFAPGIDEAVGRIIRQQLEALTPSGR